VFTSADVRLRKLGPLACRAAVQLLQSQKALGYPSEAAVPKKSNCIAILSTAVCAGDSKKEQENYLLILTLLT
jgi:hypothetical protein